MKEEEKARKEVIHMTENEALNHKVEVLNAIIYEKNDEIEQRSKMADALRRDRDKLSAEFINRLSASLKVEYRDFLDAESLPMNNELGENMREQLKNVFRILTKAGILLD